MGVKGVLRAAGCRAGSMSRCGAGGSGERPQGMVSGAAENREERSLHPVGGGARRRPYRAALLAVLALGAMLLGGCELLEQNSWQPQEPDAVSIAEDGSVTEFVSDTLDAAYYSATELEAMIQNEVAEYNAAHGEDTILIDKLEMEEGKVSLVMTYASAEDYASFNNTEFFYGTLISAQLEGYLFDVPYKKVEEGVVQAEAVDGSEVVRGLDKQVLVLKAPMEVRVPGDVLYTSANAEILSTDVVNATGVQEEEQGLVLPSNAVYKAEESSFAERSAANRVYIIFDDIH